MEISEYKIDRRVARTRKSLHQALISLILEKGYDSITVDEICQSRTRKGFNDIHILQGVW
jgi:AcrR family transcriptional regulator